MNTDLNYIVIVLNPIEFSIKDNAKSINIKVNKNIVIFQTFYGILSNR